MTINHAAALRASADELQALQYLKPNDDALQDMRDAAAHIDALQARLAAHEASAARADDAPEAGSIIVPPRAGETPEEAAARAILEPLGFAEEMAGGGCTLFARYDAYTGRKIWATASDGGLLPEPGDFMLGVYEGDDGGAGAIWDYRRGPEHKNGLLSLQEAAAAAIAIASIAPPESAAQFVADAAVLLEGVVDAYAHGAELIIYRDDGRTIRATVNFLDEARQESR